MLLHVRACTSTTIFLFGVWNHSSFHPGRNSIQLPPLSTRMYHIWNSAAAVIPSGCLTTGIQEPGWERRAFQLLQIYISGSSNSAHPDVSQPSFFLAEVLPYPNVSQPSFHSANISGWKRRAFQLPRSDISGSDDSAYPESFAAILYSAAGFSWSFPIFATDILRYFALDIWCLSPQTLLVTHQLQDSLVIKFGKRVNNLKIFCFVIFYIYLSGACSREDDASFV